MRRHFEETVGVVHPLHARRDIPRDSPEAAELSRQFVAEVVAVIARRTTKEWLAAFDAATVPAGPYQSVTELADDPQVLANDMAVGLEHPVAGSITMVGPLVRMSRTPVTARVASPTIGQHNAEILAEAGYSAPEIGDLLEHGVVFAPAQRTPGLAPGAGAA
jgi:crotonobetainyl-CoA:carnitine CoA-transferase CaiB-like acyl-CoA transferase